MTRHGSTLEVNQDQPLRIVSLLPAATEWICALGYGGYLVGVSHECDYPEIDRFGDDESARAALHHLQQRITDVRQCSARWTIRPRMTLLEWIEPLFCGGHWTPQLIQWAGGNDGLGRCGAASRLVQPEELFAMDPEILLIACCGLDADRGSRDAESLHKLPGWNDLSCVRDGQLFIFDGSAWFNRSGPRLVDALEAVSGLVTKWQGR